MYKSCEKCGYLYEDNDKGCPNCNERNTEYASAPKNNENLLTTHNNSQKTENNRAVFVVPLTVIVNYIVVFLLGAILPEIFYDFIINDTALYNAVYNSLQSLISVLVVIGAGFVIGDIKETAVGFGCRFFVSTIVGIFTQLFTAIVQYLYLSLYLFDGTIYAALYGVIGIVNVVLTAIGTFFLIRFVKNKFE